MRNLQRRAQRARLVLIGLLAGAGLSATLGWSDVAAACSSTAPPQELVGYPSYRATQVPIDVVPYYDVNRARLVGPMLGNSQFVLRSNAGVVVGVSAKQSYAWSLELVPETTLSANTTYTLEARLPAGPVSPAFVQLIEFTTGSERAAPAVKPTNAFLQHYQLTGTPLSSCDVSAAGTCIALPPGQVIAVSYIDSFAQEHLPADLWLTPTFTNLSGINQGTNFLCAKLRGRAANGTLSDPVTLCGLGAQRLALTGSAQLKCTSEGITQDGKLVPSQPGCSIVTRSVSDEHAAIWVSLALASFGALRARKRTSAGT